MLTVDVYRKQRGIDLLSVNMLGHSHKLTLETARRAVIISERNPELGGVVQVLSEPREEYKCQLNVFALVDSAVRRVYAFRINVTYEGAQAVRFLPVDAYGDALALNPIVASRAIEAPRSTEGLETFKVRRSLVFRDQPLIPFTPRVVPKFVPYVAQNEAAPVASVDTVEQAVLNLLEKRLADFVAKVTPSPQPAKADDTKLDLILAKLSQMDARMTELETQQAAHAQAVSEQLKQTVLHVENIACHSAANESAVEEVLVNVQVALESHNATREDAALLESLIKRLEVVGIDADELTAASSFQNEDIMALNNLTRRLENLGASADELSTSIKGIAVSATKESAVVAKDANVEQITIALESWNERMERLEGLVALPDVVSKSLQEIMMRQAELDADIRSSGARNPPEQLGNTNIMHKLSDLEMRIEMLPQSYKLALDLSLERQTDSLLAVLDERIETGRPLSPPTSPNNNGGTNNTKIANRLSQMRLGVPNMGIASTVQKLSGLVSNRNGGESPIQGGGSENSAIPLLEGN
ncbi:hypothetical protein BC830DRAFT_148089 [Chytriomyces sp. MP71]|nr:hypothetical protein BC830DRAFT_148089 [Chytriomyces sp. MP71]